MSIKQSTAILACLFIAASCSDGESFREKLGINRKGPDEFQVYQRPPLTVPPEFNLRPPKDGDEFVPATAVSSEDKAHGAILGVDNKPIVRSNAPITDATSVPTVSSGDLPGSADSRFLSNLGADKADKNIRQSIMNDQRNDIGPKNDKYLIGNDKSSDPTVDATKEAERIKENKAKKQPQTTGDTPVIQQDDKGVLGNIF